MPDAFLRPKRPTGFSRPRAQSATIDDLIIDADLASAADGVSAAKPSRTLPNPLARWRFKEATAPYVDDSGNYSLGQGPGATVTSVASGPWGGGISLDGVTDYLTIAAANTRDLNAARFGNQVSVVAWIKRGNTEGGFIGGMWQEDDGDPRRQYGLFMSLPTYGGEHQVCGHISKYGGASPGIPYSRDYSSSARKVGTGKYRMVAFTYDGAQMISYLDAAADERPSYTETGAPYGDGRTYAKNPYLLPDGLNRSSTIADFTVGAVKLTSGMGNHNHFNGEIGGLAVYDVALTQKELLRLHLSALTPGAPVIDLDFNNYGDASGGSVGWHSVNGNAAIDTTPDTGAANFKVTDLSGNKFTYRNSSNPLAAQPGFGYFPYVKGIGAKQLQTIKFTLNNSLEVDKVRLAVRIDGIW
ncbi:LamG domain-containing protein [Pseudarthrobacter sp. SSS035]|uniref:LamG domain-containing protein n=1 Tax=Pseudarthrobacter sp. SSS035 TaxID=2931399 RepID=UPI00200E81EE|nr:LamG domain-containing protein [Pseudarthrobacter sp. SSS035]